MAVKLEFSYIPNILPNHNNVWPNHVQVTSLLITKSTRPCRFMVDKKIIAHIINMFAGERKGLGTRLLSCYPMFEPMPGFINIIGVSRYQLV